MITEKASSKSCLNLHSLQKPYWAHMCISLRSGARGPQRLICLKYENVLKLEIRFSLGINAAENKYRL